MEREKEGETGRISLEPGCYFKTLDVPQIKPVCGGQGETGEKVAHSTLRGSRFKKQGSLLMKLVLGSCRVSRSLHPPTRILEVYIEIFTGLSLVFSPPGLNNRVFAEGCLLESSACRGRWAGSAFQQGRG